MDRTGDRPTDRIRPVSFEMNFVKIAEGSVLAKFGDTHVLCNVTVDDSLPNWLRNQPKMHGWLTAEYALLPRSTQRRVRREQRWPKGRTQEISRLIGRSLRMAVDLEALGLRQLIVDCDVIQADGGTRTASITGGYVALADAIQTLLDNKVLDKNPLIGRVASVSVGIYEGTAVLDLDYPEDCNAETDMNVVMSDAGDFIEVQGTAEGHPFSQDELNSMLALAKKGISELLASQQAALAQE